MKRHRESAGALVADAAISLGYCDLRNRALPPVFESGREVSVEQRQSADKTQIGLVICMISAIAALAGLLFGYDTGVISGALLFLKERFALSSTMQEMVVSAVLLGAVFGAATSGAVSDGIGRRKTLIGTAILFSIGALGAACANGVIWIVVCRFLIGVAIGVASYTAPLYISEISPPQARGALVSLNQLMITVGIFVSYLVDYSLSGDHQWRWMFGLGVVPAIILVVGMIFLPETPRWLVSRAFVDKARDVLKRTRRPKDIEGEIKAIEETLKQKEAPWKELFAPWVRPAFVVGIMLAFFQQATGINTVIYYAPTIFGFAGFASAKASILATAGIGLVNVLMTVVAVWLLDRWGRRRLLFIGMAGMILSLGLLGMAFCSSHLAAHLKWITVGSLVLYIASFAISLGPIFWLLIAEVYPLTVRSRAMSFATLANWGFNALVAATFLTLTETLGKAGTFWFYGAIAVVGMIFCYMYVPETKGRTLEEIEAHLRSGKKFRMLGE